jgi:phenylacetate-CoA ligase
VANSDYFFDPRLETLSANEIQARQWSLLSPMLETVFDRNLFYRRKFQQAGWQTTPRIEEWAQFPLTTKSELTADAAVNPPYGSNLTYPLTNYIRLHQTSGTTDRPVAVLDTRESWEEWMNCWSMVLRAAGVTAKDCVFVAFSFGCYFTASRVSTRIGDHHWQFFLT